MLTIVDHHQGLLGSQLRRQGIDDRLVGILRYLECCGNRSGDLIRFTHRRKLDYTDAVGESVTKFGCGGNRKA